MATKKRNKLKFNLLTIAYALFSILGMAVTTVSGLVSSRAAKLSRKFPKVKMLKWLKKKVNKIHSKLRLYFEP